MQMFNYSRISQISASGVRVQNLACLLNKEMLRICFRELDPSKAPGIDDITKEEYGKNLDANLEALVSRMKAGIYSPKPSRRVYIDKPGTNKKRPLGISCLVRKLNEILVGYFHYYEITDNYKRINAFRHETIKSLFYWLNRRSQKDLPRTEGRDKTKKSPSNRISQDAGNLRNEGPFSELVNELKAQYRIKRILAPKMHVFEKSSHLLHQY